MAYVTRSRLDGQKLQGFRSMPSLFSMPDMFRKMMNALAKLVIAAALITGSPARQASADAAPSPTATANPIVVNVMFLYTKTFDPAYAQQRINLLVSTANQALIDSGAPNVQFKVVKTLQVDYQDHDGNGHNGLTDLMNSFSVFAALNMNDLRNQYAVSEVVLMRAFQSDVDTYCGITSLNGYDPKSSYAIVRDRAPADNSGIYCGDDVFAHEMGHQFGNVHDRSNSYSYPPLFPYSYAWADPAGKWGTIMSLTQPHITLYANPALLTQCRGAPCGMPDDAPNAADNVTTLLKTAPVVAQFAAAFAPTPAPTPTPTPTPPTLKKTSKPPKGTNGNAGARLSPVITIAAPTAEEVFTLGGHNLISWSSFGFNKKSGLNISLSINNGARWIGLKSGVPAVKSMFAWTPRRNKANKRFIGNQAKIRVCLPATSRNALTCAVSDSFAIQ